MITQRDDSAFWVRCRDMEIPDSLAKRMALFRDNAQAYQAPDELFRIDPRPYQYIVDQKKAQLADAEELVRASL
jgi:hypothetical protein